MLVLTRSSDEEIRIGDDIVVRVLDVKGDRVRIGIDAPAEVPVHRQEVYLEIERANRASLHVAGAGLKGAHALLDRGQSAARPAKNPLGRARKRRRIQPRKESVNTEVEHGT